MQASPFLMLFCIIGHGLKSAEAAPLTPSAKQLAARQALGDQLPTAKLLWTNKKRIYYSSIKDWNPQLVTPAGQSEMGPRWSPDGTQIIYYRETGGVWLMNADFSDRKEVIPGGHTASWTRDGKAVTAIAADNYRVVKYTLADEKTVTIYDPRESPYNGQEVSQAAELRTGGRYLLVFRLTPGHQTEIVDLQERKYIQNDEMARGDCSPAWAPDGSYLITTARTTSRPVLKADFNAADGTIAASEHFIGLYTTYQYYIHGQRVSNDGKWVVYGGVYKGTSPADLLAGDREVYGWKIGEPESHQVQLTFDTEEDHEPDLYVPDPSASGLAPGKRTLTAKGERLFVSTEGQGTVVVCIRENITGRLGVYSVTGAKLENLKLENGKACWKSEGIVTGLYIFALHSGSSRIIEKYLVR